MEKVGTYDEGTKGMPKGSEQEHNKGGQGGAGNSATVITQGPK
jgi:hypothetical protein